MDSITVTPLPDKRVMLFWRSEEGAGFKREQLTPGSPVHWGSWEPFEVPAELGPAILRFGIVGGAELALRSASGLWEKKWNFRTDGTVDELDWSQYSESDLYRRGRQLVAATTAEDRMRLFLLTKGREVWTWTRPGKVGAPLHPNRPVLFKDITLNDGTKILLDYIALARDYRAGSDMFLYGIAREDSSLGDYSQSQWVVKWYPPRRPLDHPEVRWERVRPPSSSFMKLSHMTVGNLAGGSLQGWATAANGFAVTAWQKNPGGVLRTWVDFLTDPRGLGLYGPYRFATAQLADGRAQVWIIGTSRGILTSWKETPQPNAQWTPWSNFGAPE